MVRRKTIQLLGRLLAADDTPERIAFAFAVGVFLAFSPLLGLHTFLGLSLAFMFGLNRVAVLIGVFVNNPWTLVPIYGAAAYVGGLMIGFPATASLPDFGWHQLWHSAFWLQLAGQWRVLKPLMLGSFVLSTCAATLSYPLALYLISRGKAQK